MDDIFIIFIIGYILFYAKLCSLTIHKTETNTLDDSQKTILFITNAMGYILGILLIGIESMYISKHYSTNIPIRTIELITVISLVLIAYYGHIFRESENDTLCKISSGLWPLIGAFGVISIMCLNSIYNNVSNNNTKIPIVHI
jgi:hypothetical protein